MNEKLKVDDVIEEPKPEVLTAEFMKNALKQMTDVFDSGYLTKVQFVVHPSTIKFFKQHVRELDKMAKPRQTEFDFELFYGDEGRTDSTYGQTVGSHRTYVVGKNGLLVDWGG